MKKTLFISVLAVLAITLLSWGWAGHKTVAVIAENHLSIKAKAGVQMLLRDTTMADVASWADEVLKQPEYKNTAPQHYINVPLGLSYTDFSKAVLGKSEYNLYQAVVSNLFILKSPASTPQQKTIALKFIIHFVGDIHQPMHISRGEDKGGNTIQVQFDGKGTNLHSLWDGKLIGKEGKSFQQMAIDYDSATPTEVKQWQSDDMMKWLYESYQISSKLYAEIEVNNKLDDKYFKEHIPIVQKRIEMAGVRLAGLLNDAFKDLDVKVKYVELPPPPISPKLIPQAPNAELKDLKNLIGKEVTTQGVVNGVKDIGSMVLVNLGAAYPNQLLTIALKGSAKALAASLDKQVVKVTGTVIDYKGKPEIIVTDEKNITVMEIVGDNKHRAPSGG